MIRGTWFALLCTRCGLEHHTQILAAECAPCAAARRRNRLQILQAEVSGA